HSPFVMLADRKANEDYGRVWGFSLVWSGSFQASAEQDQFGQTRFSMGLDDEDFNYPLQPGQELVLPEVMMSFSSCGMEKLSHNFHDIIRGNLIRGPWKNKRRPVLLNSWETAGFDFNGDSILELADEAAATGMEMLVLDDGWFGNRNSDNEGLGDWFANTAKLGCSIKEFSKKIHDRGLMFGLWFEPEMVSEDSELYRSHPEYAMHIPGRRPVRGRNQLVLDFSHDAVVDAVYEQVTKVLDGAGIDYLKWDMNRSITDVYENGFGKGAKLYRYVLGVYRFMNKLLVRYPGLLLETCSGGGGRFDAGMLYYSPQIWCSDNTDPIERLAIQYGTSFGFPANTMGAHVGAEKNPNNGRVTELNTRAAAASAGVLGYELDLTKLSGREKKEIREQIDTYKQDWPLIDSGNYYRLDDIDRKDHHSAWMFVSENQDRAVLQVVTTDTRFKAPTEYILLKGLKKDSFYQSRESGKIYSGSALMSAGIFLPRFREEYKALKIHFEEVNA
ncbi:MAG: alpha-galactosidase, partial [Eubacteriaceae bacterium]